MRFIVLGNKVHFSMAFVLSMMTLTGCQTKVVTRDDVLVTSKVDVNQSALTRTALASEYIKIGQLDAAKRSLEQALDLNPKLPEAHLMMAVLLQQEGSKVNRLKAEGYFKSSLKLQKPFAQANNNYGVFLQEDGRYDEALKHFEIAATTLGYSGRSQALENLGRLQVLMKQPIEAKASFLKAISIDGYSAVSFLELADLSMNDNNIKDANIYFQRYLSLVSEQGLGARSLWLGARIAHAFNEWERFTFFANQLNMRFAGSAEDQYAQQLMQYRSYP